jgi:hypothetical protein
MSDWRVNDLALCVDQSGWMMAITGMEAEGPTCGQVLPVKAVKVTTMGTFLGFAQWPRQGFFHTGFVKVTPTPEIIEEERKAGLSV